MTEIQSNDGKECVICYEPLSVTKNVCITECGHEFCFSCMMKHVQRNNGCPCCRATIIDKIDSDMDDSVGDYEDDDITIEEDSVLDEDEPEYEIEALVSLFEISGYGLKDALSLLMNRFSKTDPKYTKTYIKQLEEDFEDIKGELEQSMEEDEEDVAVAQPDSIQLSDSLTVISQPI